MRLHQNLLIGQISDNPLLIGATQVNSPAFVNLPAVATPDYIVLTLDPARINGAPEIIYVTAHTAGQPVATVLRAQEGSAARQHAAGETWIHGATSQDFWGAGGVWYGDQTVQSGIFTLDRLRLTATGDASVASTGHAFQVGPDTGVNIIIDQNEIVARSNGAPSDLFLNNQGDGGSVLIGNGSSAGKLGVAEQVTDPTTTTYGVHINETIELTAASPPSLAHRALYAQLSLSPSAATTVASVQYGMIVYVQTDDSGTLAGGVEIIRANSYTIVGAGNTGSTAFVYQFHAMQPTRTAGSTATIGQWYGLKVENGAVSYVTDYAWGWYTAGSSLNNYSRGRLGIGTNDRPQYPLEVIPGNLAQAAVHIQQQAGGGNLEGMFLGSYSVSSAYVAAAAEITASATTGTIARGTTASIYEQVNAVHNWYADTGLTIGGTYTRTKIASLDSGGLSLSIATSGATTSVDLYPQYRRLESNADGGLRIYQSVGANSKPRVYFWRSDGTPVNPVLSIDYSTSNDQALTGNGVFLLEANGPILAHIKGTVQGAGTTKGAVAYSDNDAHSWENDGAGGWIFRNGWNSPNAKVRFMAGTGGAELLTIGDTITMKPPTWHYVGTAGEPAFQNSWVNFTAVANDWTNVRFSIDAQGWVTIEGLAKNGTLTGNPIIFTLPVGYRPSTFHQFVGIAGANVPVRIDVNTDGTVRYIGTGAGTPTNGQLSLWGRFSVNS